MNHTIYIEIKFWPEFTSTAILYVNNCQNVVCCLIIIIIVYQ